MNFHRLFICLLWFVKEKWTTKRMGTEKIVKYFLHCIQVVYWIRLGIECQHSTLALFFSIESLFMRFIHSWKFKKVFFRLKKKRRVLRSHLNQCFDYTWKCTFKRKWQKKFITCKNEFVHVVASILGFSKEISWELWKTLNRNSHKLWTSDCAPNGNE